MTLDLIIDGCPAWAAADGLGASPATQPASSAAFAKYAAAVASRYFPLGVSIYELWNEPNIAEFWQPAPNPAAYTADLIAAYEAVKTVAPSATVVSGGLAPSATDGTDYSPVDFLKAMYADGAKGNFDTLGDHPYSYPALPNTFESWSGWSQMDQTITSLRSVMVSEGDGKKQIWATEFGAPSAGPDGVGQAGQAEAIVQAITDAKSLSWLGALYIYTWQDPRTDPSNDEDRFGLLEAAGQPKLAYREVSSAIR